MTFRKLKLQEIAEHTASSLSFWRKQVRLGTIPAIRVGRLVRIDEQDLEEWIAKRKSNTQKRKPTGE
jgi:excisionase family DNA binding protein